MPKQQGSSNAWRCTTKPGKLYIHIFEWPANGTFELSQMKQKAKHAYFLVDPKHKGLKLSQQGEKLIVTLPRMPAPLAPTVLVIDHSL